MSGVYIKGFDIPENCDQCPVCDYEQGECLVGKGKFVEYENRLVRQPWCPLSPVPKHGRLIDADELKEFCWEAVNDSKNDFLRKKDWKFAVQVTEGFCQDIDEAPTVIPKDEE